MKVSGIFFAIVIIAFLMPFMVVKCGDTTIASISGVKLVTGGKIANPQLEELQEMSQNMAGMMDAESQEEETEEKDNRMPFKANPYAILGLLAAIAGLVSALVLKKGAFIAPVVLAVVGIISLLLIKGPVKSAVGLSTAANASLQSMVVVKAQFGYYLAFIAYLLAGITAVLLGRKEPMMTREQFVQYVPNSVENAFEQAKESVGTVSAGLATKLDDVIDDAKDKYQDTVDKLQDKIDTSGIEEKIDAVADKVKGMVGSEGKIADVIDDAKDKIKDLVDGEEEKP